VIRHKFHARPQTVDGKWFGSKKEANYYQQLELAKKSGELLFYLQQIPIRLPGGVTYRCDFLEFWRNGDVRFIDVKGFKTQSYIAKKKMVEALYPIEILEA